MLETPRLWLVPVSESLLTALLEDRPLLVNNNLVTVPSDWADLWADHPGALAYTLQGLRDDSTLQASGWWSYLFVYQAEHKLVGMGGFKGKPQAASVELGYGLIPSYRSQGFASEAARELVRFALASPGIDQVVAHTLAADNHSNQLLKK